MLGGIIFILIGLLGLIDTLAPQRLAQARAYGDFVGFMLYVGLLSAGILIGGCVLCFKNRADLGKLRSFFNMNLRFSSARQVSADLLESKSFITFLILGHYALITPFLGYAITTLLFFFVLFGWGGYKWSLRNLVLSLITTVAFVALAHIAEIPVPAGFLSW
jgi:hypothetical protein